MNQIKNISKIKDPYLKLKYAKGLGDIVACFLHSKPIGWLTKLITGKDKPCSKCFKRGNALNILFPIKIWKIFFKTEEEYIETFRNDLQNYGYIVNSPPNNDYISTTKIEKTPIPSEPLPEPQTTENNHILLTSTENQVGEFLIKTQIFKVK